MTPVLTPARAGAGRDTAAAVSIPGPDLRRLVAAVAPHAAADPDTPALCAVQWEVRGGTLWIAATDMYTIAAARWPLPAGGTPAATGPVLVPAGEALALAEAVGADLAAVTIDPAASAVTAAWTGGTYQARQPVPVPGEIPDWRGVLADLVDGQPASPGGRIMFDPSHLTRFTVRLSRGRPDSDERPPLVRFQLRRHLSNRRLMYLVTCQDWFIGAISPLTAGPGADEYGGTIISHWAECLHAPAGGTSPGGGLR